MLIDIFPILDNNEQYNYCTGNYKFTYITLY